VITEKKSDNLLSLDLFNSNN